MSKNNLHNQKLLVILRMMFYVLKHPVLLIILFNLIFFIEPIISNLYLSPSDALQRFPSFNLGKHHAPKNSLLFDSVTQFQPWYFYIKESFRRGDFVLWNNNNASGVPFLANSQSAVFFPLSIVYYLVPFRLATILFSLMKLILLGMFTYIFLRELGLNKWACLVGAVTFNFAGFNIVWLLWPHTNVIIFLPLLFYLIEKLYKGSWREKHLFLAFSLTTFCAITAGHPETLFHVYSISSFYFLYKLFKQRTANRKIKLIRIYFLSIVLGIMLSGIILAPFLEYLFESYAWYERRRGEIGRLISPIAIVYTIFPNLSGNPSEPFYKPLFNSTYHGLVGAYVGPLMLTFSILGILFMRNRDKRYRFFIIVGLLVIPFIYKIAFISNITLYLSRIVVNSRLIFFLAFAQSIMGAIFLHNLSKNKRVRKLAIFLVIFVLVCMFIALVVIEKYGPMYLYEFSQQKVIGFIAYEKRQVLILSLTFVSGILTFYLMQKGKLKRLGYFVIVTLVFIQTGFLNIKYNPAINRRYFYPETTSIKFLRNLPRGDYMELGGNYVIPADINLFYRLSTIHNYDALDIKNFRILYNEIFDKKTDWQTILKADNRYLDFFGVDYVLSYSDIDKKIEFNQTNTNKLHGELTYKNSINLNFTASDNYLTAIRLLPANYNRENNCNFVIKLFDENNLQLLDENYKCSEVYDRIFMQVSFPKIDNSKNRVYRLVIESLDAYPGNAISFWEDSNGELVFNTIYDVKDLPGLELIHEGGFKIFRNNSAFENFFLVNKVKLMKENEIIGYIKKYPEVMTSEVILSTRTVDKGILDYKEVGELNLIEDRQSYKKLKVKDKDGGYLVSTNPYYPGWNVFVDGQKSELLRANFAFYAVYLPAGEHVIEIIYKPISFYFGAIISLLGLMILLRVVTRKV